MYPQITEAIYNNVFEVLNGGSRRRGAEHSQMSSEIEEALKRF